MDDTITRPDGVKTDSSHCKTGSRVSDLYQPPDSSSRLFTHDEMITLFHEFGPACTMLTRDKKEGLAGYLAEVGILDQKLPNQL